MKKFYKLSEYILIAVASVVLWESTHQMFFDTHEHSHINTPVIQQ
jgi:hypothetical protein